MKRLKIALTVLGFALSLMAVLLNIFGIIGDSFSAIFFVAVVAAGFFFPKYVILIALFYATAVLTAGYALGGEFRHGPSFIALMLLFTALIQYFFYKNAIGKLQMKFDTVVEASRVIVCALSEKGSIVYASPNAYKAIGYRDSELTGKQFLNYIYEEDRPKVEELFHNALKSSGLNGQCELRIVNKNGGVTWHLVSGSLFIWRGNRLFYASAQDITPRKLALLKLGESEERLRIMSEISFEGILMHKDGIVKDCNDAFSKLTGFPREEIIGKSILDFIFPDDCYKINENIKLQNIKPYIVRAVKKDGSIFYMEIEMRSLTVNHDVYRAGAVRDVTERKAREDEIINLSNRDYLTGVYNRRYFEDRITEADNESEYTLIMADINGLKLINDSFGDSEGDRFLKRAAGILSRVCGRAGNVVARYGGDEFVVLLCGDEWKKAEKYIKEIKTQLDRTKDVVELSVAFGYAAKSRPDQSAREVLKEAENNMDKWKLYETASVRSKTIQVILSTLYEKSPREMLHSKRVGKISEKIALAMDLGDEDVRRISIAGLMHDIGKIGIEENILNKPAKLTDDEYTAMKRHPEIGYRILSSSEEFHEIAGIVLYHHERWDGRGYPKGLAGEEIPLLSRIITVADSYDAMVTDRPYRKGLTQAEAVQEIQTNAGRQFDPKIAKLFVEKVLTAIGKEVDQINNKIQADLADEDDEDHPWSIGTEI